MSNTSAIKKTNAAFNAYVAANVAAYFSDPFTAYGNHATAAAYAKYVAARNE